MKPYYEQDGVTIFHGDCRDILPSLPRVDAVVTDPPYGIGADSHQGPERHGWKQYGKRGWDSDRPDAETLRAVIAHGRHAIVWGGNYFSDVLPFVPRGKWLIWDKGQSGFSLADCEMAWCSWEGAIRRFLYARGAALKDGKQHPTQKPLALMAWTLPQLPGWERVRTIADPFMGVGSTLVEAKRLGREAFGIDREERYCEIAAKRLAQGALDLFGEATA